MNSTILNARTVAIARDLKVEKRQGANGEFEAKDILVRIAVDRDYKMTRTENGKTISENPTDFWLCKFTGNLAQVFADNCCAKREDGKLISRHLLISGNFERYTKTREVKCQPQVNINGVMYQLDLTVPVQEEAPIFMADALTFLDSNPVKKSAVTASATPVVASVTPLATPTVEAQAPVVEAQAPTVEVQAPVVAQSFDNTGEVAPF